MLGWGESTLGGYQYWQLGDCDADLSLAFSIDKTFERLGHLPILQMGISLTNVNVSYKGATPTWCSEPFRVPLLRM